VMELINTILLVGLFISLGECRLVKTTKSIDYQANNCRKHSALLTDFGAVGDGKTMNTKAFKDAIANLSSLAADGGAQLIVPPGKWLTGSFNLTSHFTLFLHKGAVILASQAESDWPLFPPLPSYGKGRDAPDARFSALIFGTNLTDVIVTGNNGTVDGQGAPWWDKFKQKKLNATRPYLLEIMYSDQVQISDITFTNSPSWHVHPIYCRNLLIQGVTILAPVTVPNTDGINPDSCINTRIQDCYIVSGDDCIAVKSGWDQYGIRFAMPTQHLVIRRLTCISPDSATVALGSEMSGGIQDVRIEDITAINTQSGVRVKTAVGRGGFIKDIFVRNFKMDTMEYVFWMTGDYGSHPDNGFDPKALPQITNINHRDMVANNVTISAKVTGLNGDKFTGLCISNVTIKLAKEPKKLQWNCTNVEGVLSNVKVEGATSKYVNPQPCDLFTKKETTMQCPFPEDKLPIDQVQLKTCSVATTL
ncbi:Glyco_hydro_28 domain-containing protein, partial [Cephalotus follicularis]